jgi:single-strand DNA-binding protein
MAGSLNKVLIMGNLGRDPEVRNMQDGSKVAQLSIATTESWKDKASGERKDRTEWHRVVVFNEKLAEIAERYLRKGSRVYVEGQLQTRKWTDPATNQERYTTEIVLSRFRGEMLLMDNRASGDSRPDEIGNFSNDTPASSPAQSSQKPMADFDDEIPF